MNIECDVFHEQFSSLFSEESVNSLYRYCKIGTIYTSVGMSRGAIFQEYVICGANDKGIRSVAVANV